jgi:hypothetical protein
MVVLQLFCARHGLHWGFGASPIQRLSPHEADAGSERARTNATLASAIAIAPASIVLTQAEQWLTPRTRGKGGGSRGAGSGALRRLSPAAMCWHTTVITFHHGMTPARTLGVHGCCAARLRGRIS